MLGVNVTKVEAIGWIVLYKILKKKKPSGGEEWLTDVSIEYSRANNIFMGLITRENILKKLGLFC